MKGEKVLIVDDESGIVYLLEELLVSAGYETISATTGVKAIEIIKAEKVNLMILDYQLPLLNGLDVLREIRKLNKEIPVIMMTGMAEHIELEVDQFKQVKSLLRKPFNIDEVLKLVEEHTNLNKIQA